MTAHVPPVNPHRWHEPSDGCVWTPSDAVGLGRARERQPPQARWNRAAGALPAVPSSCTTPH